MGFEEKSGLCVCVCAGLDRTSCEEASPDTWVPERLCGPLPEWATHFSQSQWSFAVYAALCFRDWCKWQRNKPTSVAYTLSHVCNHSDGARWGAAQLSATVAAHGITHRIRSDTRANEWMNFNGFVFNHFTWHVSHSDEVTNSKQHVKSLSLKRFYSYLLAVSSLQGRPGTPDEKTGPSSP